MNHSLREEGKSHKIILETIGRNGHDREIIRGLRAGESHQAIADWLVRENPDLETLDPQTTTHRKLVGVVKLFEAQYQEQDSLHRPNSSDYKLQWTNVTTNTNFIGHLFDLYFTWVHPIHMLFSELEFKEDFKFNQENHCSASLVNAICAMACNLLETEHGLDRQNPLDAATLRDNFMREARKFLLPESYRVLTSVQTFAVLFLVELSSGKARNAIGYLRSAIDNIKFQDSVQHSEEAKELTLWGIQTLNSYDRYPLPSHWVCLFD